MISIVIPAYNEQDSLPICLDSLTKQTIPVTDFEVIVVNNASTDQTASEALKFKQKLKHEAFFGFCSERLVSTCDNLFFIFLEQFLKVL